MPRTLLLALGLALAAFAPAAAAVPWLFASDLHVDAGARGVRPAQAGEDSNWALIDSTIAAMRRAVPDAPVIVLGGDFLAHSAPPRALRATLAELARRFDRAFPHAQFLLVLGNIDSACGDYAAPDPGLLRAVARAWEPLVNRHGAAPAFATTFARDGSYSAALPRPGLRAVVVDDVSWSVRYRGGCGAPRDLARTVRDELRAAARGPAGRPRWVLFHVPPGIDAYSTAHLARGLAIVPFLNPAPRDALLASLTAPEHHVVLAVAGHTHKFGLRAAPAARGAVPLVLVPSVSPIFGNAPSFLVVDVKPSGTVADAREISYVAGRWTRLGGLHDLGMRAVDGPEVTALAQRLTHDAHLRARFALLYNGGVPGEITESNWRAYVCAFGSFTATAARACMNQGGYSIFTSRGLAAVAVGLIAGVAACGALGLAIAGAIRRRSSGRSNAASERP